VGIVDRTFSSPVARFSRHSRALVVQRRRGTGVGSLGRRIALPHVVQEVAEVLVVVIIGRGRTAKTISSTPAADRAGGPASGLPRPQRPLAHQWRVRPQQRPEAPQAAGDTRSHL
jgi:hypothetical protein